MTTLNDIHIIIVAGGVGSRIGSSIPKQFMHVEDKEILQHTIDALVASAPKAHYIVVMHPNYMHRQAQYNELYPNLNMEWIAGGDTRFDSSKNGLALCPDEGIVYIHDAARPFVSSVLMKDLYEASQENEAVIPYTLPSASVRQVSGSHSKMLDRSSLRMIQTPQAFDLPTIKKAYKQNYIPLFTDDASVVETIGTPITLIQGDPRNIKLTTPSDLELAAYMMRRL